jgi:hypothetical protein
VEALLNVPESVNADRLNPCAISKNEAGELCAARITNLCRDADNQKVCQLKGVV